MRHVIAFDALFIQECERLRLFAENPRNWYVPTETKVPGDLPAHVLLHEDLRIVFSITKFDGVPKRHLSISLSGGRGGYPHPYTALTIATLLGFSGAEAMSLPDCSPIALSVRAGKDWDMALSKQPALVLAAQDFLEGSN